MPPVKIAMPVKGFTLIELMIAVLIMAVATAIALPLMDGFVERSRQADAISILMGAEMQIESFVSENFRYPDTLAEAGINGLTDPWGNPYTYLRIDGAANNVQGQVRRDKNLNPINSDFDLYSPGPDGATVTALTAMKARDDIIRAGNGSFYGVAEDF